MTTSEFVSRKTKPSIRKTGKAIFIQVLNSICRVFAGIVFFSRVTINRNWLKEVT